MSNNNRHTPNHAPPQQDAGGSAQRVARRRRGDDYIVIHWHELLADLAKLRELPPARQAELCWAYFEITAAVVINSEPVPLNAWAAAVRVGVDRRRWRPISRALEALGCLERTPDGWTTPTARKELRRRVDRLGITKKGGTKGEDRGEEVPTSSRDNRENINDSNGRAAETAPTTNPTKIEISRELTTMTPRAREVHKILAACKAILLESLPPNFVSSLELEYLRSNAWETARYPLPHVCGFLKRKGHGLSKEQIRARMRQLAAQGEQS